MISPATQHWAIMLSATCWLLLVSGGCGVAVTQDSEVIAITGPTMGTRYHVKCWDQNYTGNSAPLEDDINTLLNKINEQMSTYLPDSELSRFNASSTMDWFDISEETAFVADRALHFHKLTDGASDVTVGPLVKLWDFGPGRHPSGSAVDSPDAELLAATKSRTGAEHVEVRLSAPAIRKSIENLEVDLSSIAKGYAADAVAELLIARGITNFMVEIGGEVRAGGTRQDDKLWRIGAEAPTLNQRVIHKVVPLRDQAMATSGDYRNYRTVDGEKVSHIIDPKTGRPLPYRGWSVTVLAPTCLEADALATALLVMGVDRGYAWCVEHKIEALFLIRDGNEIIEKATPGFPSIDSLTK